MEQDFKSVILKSKGKSFDAIGSLVLRSQIFSFCDQSKALETAIIIGELFGLSTSYSFTPQMILERVASVRREASSVGAYRYTETPRGGKAISFNERVLIFKDGAVGPLR